MGIKTSGKKSFFLTLVTLMIAGTLIVAGCSGGGGTAGSTSGSTGGTTGGDTGGGTAAKATLSGQLLSSSSSGSSLFKRSLGKAAAATSSLPVSGATVLCFDTDSVSTAAAGTATTDSSGNWNMEVDAGNYACFGVYIDLTSLTIKTARLTDIRAEAGQTTTVEAATVESDTTSPTIVSVLSDNVADTSLSDGDPDPLYEISDVLPTQPISVIFSEAMSTSTMTAGNGLVLKDSSGAAVSGTVKFNGTGTEFRFTPDSSLNVGATYTLYITNKAKDLSNNGINDPDSDGVVALARITVAEAVDPFAYLSSSPKNSDTGVSVYKDLTVTFNRPVDFVSFKENTSISPTVSGRLEPSGDGVTFFHPAPLSPNTTYTITIGADVADLAGNTLGAPTTITFTTGAGVDASSVSGYDAGGGTTEDLLAIVAGLNKAMLALDNQDLVTFSSFFAPTFTITERDCFYDPSREGEICETSTQNLADFLAYMKRDIIEQRNMAKGFGQVKRAILTGANGSEMSVEMFNSSFDADRKPTGVTLAVGWPNRREGVDFINSEVDVPDPWSPDGMRREKVTYRLSGSCRDLADPSELAGAGEVKATYHYWDETVQRDKEVTRICPVYDGDADATNSWRDNDEIYPVSWTGPRNVGDDNDQDCSPGVWDCQNEDGIILLKDNNGDGVADQALRYYETVDPTTFMRSPNQRDITAQLQAAGGLTVAAAMEVAAANNWDIEGVDNDGDSRIVTWDSDGDGNPDGGFIERRVNEDWPNGMDDDGDCDANMDGKSDDTDNDGVIDGTNRVCIDEDHDGMGDNPWPQDGDDDTTNDPMPGSDWNLANKDDVMSNDEFWAQTFLVDDSALASDGAAQWTDEAAGTVYYQIQGPKGWPYPYAAGADGRPWSGDEFDQYSGSGTSLDSHVFAWADVDYNGKVYFRNDDKSAGTFRDRDRGVYVDLTEAGFIIENGQISNPSERVGGVLFQTGEYDAALYRWDGTGSLRNDAGTTVDWQYVRPMMDSIDYNADGDWNINTSATSGLRRVPHDRVTGGIMPTADYLALGWETWRVSNDYQLISNPTIVWDVEADWARMEGDDDGDGSFNEDGLYSDYFNSDGSLKTCTSSANWPCMTRDETTGVLTLFNKDGTTTTSFDISDGVDNDFDGKVDEVEPFDDDGDGTADEDPVGDPNDLNGNGNTIEPYDDDGDGRKDEDPVSYERDRINDHTQWARIYQETTDAVVEMFYLETDTALSLKALAIDGTGKKAMAVVDITDTETWTPHNPWGEDFNRDGEPDDVNTWTETKFFNLEKISGKWLLTNIQSIDSMEQFNQQTASGEIKAFGGNIARIEMVSPVGDPMTGPAVNQTITPTFVWDDSDVSGTIGSYLIHIEEITETMVTSGGEPTSVMMLLLNPSEVTTDPETGVHSFTLGSGGTDVTNKVLTAMKDDPYFPFKTALTALESGKAYAWGILAFSEATLDFTSGKPEPMGDSFEPMMFATTDLPSYFTSSTFASRMLPKAKIGGVEYNTIPSNIAPSFYDRPSGSNSRHHMPSSVDPRLHQ